MQCGRYRIIEIGQNADMRSQERLEFIKLVTLMCDVLKILGRTRSHIVK